MRLLEPVLLAASVIATVLSIYILGMTIMTILGQLSIPRPSRSVSPCLFLLTNSKKGPNARESLCTHINISVSVTNQTPRICHADR